MYITPLGVFEQDQPRLIVDPVVFWELLVIVVHSKRVAFMDSEGQCDDVFLVTPVGVNARTFVKAIENFCASADKVEKWFLMLNRGR